MDRIGEKTAETVAGPGDPPGPAASLPIWLDAVIAIAGGLLAYMSFHPVAQSWLIWFALAPMLYFLRYRSFGRALVLTQLGCLVFYFLALIWVAEVTWAGMSAMAFIIAVVYCGAFVCVVRLGMKYTKLPFSVLAVSAWILIVEYIRSEQPVLSFHWIILGHSLWDWPWIIQIADIGGSYLVSALVLLVNLAVMETCTRLLQLTRADKTRFVGARHALPLRERKYLILAGATVLALVLTLLYGIIRLRTLEIIEGPKVVTVQGNIPQDHKEIVLRGENPELSAEFEHRMLDDHLRLMAPALEEEDVDLVVWPETMVPGRIVERAELLSMITRYAKRIGSGFLFGSQHYIIDRTKELVCYNSCFLINKKGEVVGRYDKTVLVPVGEFIPFKWLPLMRNFLGRLTPYGASDISSGKPGPCFTTAGMKYAPLICFEITMPAIVRKMRKRGCDAVINISNDAWFRRSAELDLSLAQAVFRAVETRMGVLRVVNTGISAFVGPDGSYKALTVEVDGKPKRKQVEGTLIDRVRYTRQGTLYVSLGDWFAWLCLLVVLYVLGCSVFRWSGSSVRQ
ncbi:MAG: apolipoprotein N-acyltransferase [Planctomycetota bacterium]|nr:MAG: apolipoprotein N-acyltransferase [Planctomycetota bacterium]